MINDISFSRDGFIVGESRGFPAISEGYTSTTYCSTEEPSEVEVSYQIPFNGTDTVYFLSSSGLAEVSARFRNLTVDIPDFTPGTSAPIVDETTIKLFPTDDSARKVVYLAIMDASTGRL